jgi:hypothetical protein
MYIKDKNNFDLLNSYSLKDKSSNVDKVKILLANPKVEFIKQ